MKSQALALLALSSLPLSAQAAGFHCQAYCVDIDAYGSSRVITVTTPLEYTAGIKKREVFRGLEKLCSKRLPYGRLADTIAWKLEGSYSRTSGRNPRPRGGRIEFDEWLTSRSSGELSRNFEKESIQVRGGYSLYRVDHHGRTTELNRCEASQIFEYRIHYSTPDSACEADAEIEDGEVPYTGDLPVLG